MDIKVVGVMVNILVFAVLLLSSSAGIAVGGEGESRAVHPRGCGHNSHMQSAVKTAFACQEAGICTQQKRPRLDQTLHHHRQCLLLPGAGMDGEEVEGEGRNDRGQRLLGGVVSAVFRLQRMNHPNIVFACEHNSD